VLEDYGPKHYSSLHHGACVRVFKVKAFVRFARRERVGDASLCEAVDRAERGLVDADLGGGLIKQRLARQGQGRSGGYRVLVAYRPGSRAVFLHAFAKSERDNIDDNQLATLREIAAAWQAADAAMLSRALASGTLQEVVHDS
jgi:hypothetical protein